MSKNNEHFDTNIFGPRTNSASGNGYEYVFSSGIPKQSQNHEKKPKKNGSHAAIFILILILCVTLSFISGIGGVLYARSLFEAESENNESDSPSDDSIYHDNPASIIDKNDNGTPAHGSAGEDVFTVSQVVQKVQDSVVELDVTFSVETFYGTQATSGSGSGVLISADGYILTCHHVIANENATTKSISVTLNSGAVFEAALVGYDARTDLAVIKIEPKEGQTFTFAEHGKSARLLVGEHVVAIGNPLGTLGGTVTNGIISATERNIKVADGTEMTLLQTNAAVNSGNSGGGLFNLDGQLIGIVNAKYAAEGVEGLAFAIPIDLAYEVELDLIQYGYIRGIADHGLEVWEVNSENLYSNYYRYNIKTIGVYVVTSAFNSNLQYKDRIVSVNGTSVATETELNKIVNTMKVGDVLTIVYEREGESFTTELTLGEYVPDYMKSQDAS
ncbi:MAG: trypsin-like serine protease [Ruminococcaceae bacterium]|nr:trypsin-like serine protease [Oscillospiraceae bacterium]